METMRRERVELDRCPGGGAHAERFALSRTVVPGGFRAAPGGALNRPRLMAAQASGLSCCSRVGKSSLTVGWMCMAREITV